MSLTMVPSDGTFSQVAGLKKKKKKKSTEFDGCSRKSSNKNKCETNKSITTTTTANKMNPESLKALRVKPSDFDSLRVEQKIHLLFQIKGYYNYKLLKLNIIRHIRPKTEKFVSTNTIYLV